MGEGIKDKLKEITMENIKFQRKSEGLIILIHGDSKKTREYANYFYLKLEPNNTKIVTRKGTCPLFWIKYAPEFGCINILLHGWFNNRKAKKGYKKWKDKNSLEHFNELEQVLKINGIRVLKIYIHGEKKKEIDVLKEKNSKVFQWYEIEGSSRNEELRQITAVILKEFQREDLCKGKMNHQIKIQKSNRVKGFKDNQYTMDCVKRGFKDNTDKIVNQLEKREMKLIVVFEGMDASGKGSAIKKVFMGINPQKYDLYRISEPYRNEKNTHFLKRFIPKVFNNKPLAVFDRSWYGRVLVEKVEKLDDREKIENSFEGIYLFEKGLVESGIHLLKFWIDISPEEQLRRFKKRIKKENKRWKIDYLDWKNRMKLENYKKVSEEMFRNSSYDFAPWIIIQGDSKKNAEIEVKRKIISYIEKNIL